MITVIQNYSLLIICNFILYSLATDNDSIMSVNKLTIKIKIVG